MMDVKSEENGFHFDANTKGFLGVMPSAAVIWSSPATVYALNESARRLIGFSESDVLVDSGFWSKRVYCSDKIIFAERQKKMAGGATEITCDYRFYPKGLSEPIRIREMIFSLRDPTGQWKWISMYSDISDLKRSSSENRNGFIREEMRESIRCLFHEIKNRLHLLSMELELAALEPGENLDTKKFARALHDLNHSIKELHDCLIPGRNDLSSRD
jgi:hypothetical protein